VSHTHLYIRIYRSSHTRRHTHFCNWWQIIILSGGVPWKHVWIPHWKDLIVDVHCNVVLYYNLPTDGWNKDMHACILCMKQCLSAVTFQVTHALIVSRTTMHFFVAMHPSTLETEQPSTKLWPQLSKKWLTRSPKIALVLHCERTRVVFTELG